MQPTSDTDKVLAASLIDAVRMDVVPVVFGSGKRYFGSVHAQHLLEDPDVVIQGNRVLHCAIGCAVDRSMTGDAGFPFVRPESQIEWMTVYSLRGEPSSGLTPAAR